MLNYNIQGVLAPLPPSDDGYIRILPFSQELNIYQQDDGYLNVFVVNSNTDSVDLTGCEVRITCRDSAGVLIFTYAATIIDAATGQARFTILSTDTDTDANTYKYDIVLIKDNTTSHIVPVSFLNILKSTYRKIM